MFDAPVASVIDLNIVLPQPGVIRIVSTRLFSDPDDELCHRFLRRVFSAPEIEDAVIAPEATPTLELHFDGTRHSQRAVLQRVADLLRGSGDLAAHEGLAIAPASTARDRHGVVRYRRFARRLTGWRVEHERIGSLRLSNPVLYRKAALCEAIERELMSVLGVHRYDTSSVKCRVDIEYDPRQLSAAQIIEVLDGALAGTEHPVKLDKLNRDLTICTLSVPVAAVAQLAVPALLPVAAALFLYTTLPSFQGAWRVITKERRLGVDVLDSIVVLACLGTLQIMPGAILAWCLSFGRYLVRRTEDNSKKLLLGAFGKQPASRPICSRLAPTFALSRCCSAMPGCRPRHATLKSLPI